MSSANLPIPNPRLIARGECLHKPGAVKLDHIKYPLLVYAPIEHGEGIRTEDHGVHIAEICNALAVHPDIIAVAAKFNTTPEHVRQAVAYAQEAGAFE